MRRAWLVVGAISAAMNIGCASTWAERYPQARIYRVCARPTSLESDAQGWVYSNANEAISSANEEQFDAAARTSRRLFRYDPDAALSSVLDLPTPDDRMVCPDRYRPLPEKEDSAAPLPDEGLVFADHDERCRRFQDENDPQKAAMYFGQAPDVKSGWFCGGRPTYPDVEHLARENAKKEAADGAREVGRRYGLVMGGAKAGMEQLIKGTDGEILQDFKENPWFLDKLQQGLADRLNAIPDPPTYEDRELALAAEAGFKEGFGQGVDAIQAQFAALTAACTTLQLMSANIGLLVETAGAKALRLALARFRGLPIFVPGTAGGAGFFLRVPKTLPKPPPGNVNAPSLPVGVVPPPVSVPLPFGNLSRAAEFGIKPYNQLIKAVQGTGLEGHHLIEQRFINVMGTDPRMNLTVAVTNAEHQQFTNAWRDEIAYGAAGTYRVAMPAEVLDAARKVYKNYPAILKALGL